MHTRSKHFLWITVSVADDPPLHANGIKTLLANSLTIFPIKSHPTFNNGSKGLPENPPDFPMFCNSVFDKFILAEEIFAKVSRILTLVY